MAERAQRPANRKNTCKLRKQLPQFYNARAAKAHDTTKKRNVLQIEKKHLQIKKTLSSILQRTGCKSSQHTQKRNALQIKCIWLCCEHLQCDSLFVCVVSICTICCQNDENGFLICLCFFYLHVFSEVAARWALSATVIYSITASIQHFENIIFIMEVKISNPSV